MRPLILCVAVLLMAPAAKAAGFFPVVRWVIEGDTQDFALAGASLPHPNPWDATHQALCGQATAKNLQGVIGTGDIIDAFGFFGRQVAFESMAADHAYDITDACGLESILPAGNHDFYGQAVGAPPPPNNSDRYLWFLARRPLHDPSQRSASGLSWSQPLAGNFRILVLPYEADPAEEAFADRLIANSPAAARFFLMQHEAVDPGMRPDLPNTAASRIAARHGPTVVPLVLGGHYKPNDKVTTFVTPSGGRALFVNFQTADPRNGNQPYWGYVVWLEFSAASGRWCFYDENILTGERNRFEPTTCWTP